MLHAGHLGQALAGSIEESEGGGLLQEATTGRAGFGQRGLRVRGKKKHALRVECVLSSVTGECDGFVKATVSYRW
jgi:hypothetical protein